MKSNETVAFETAVKGILEWSSLDAGTKGALQALMREVAVYVEKATNSK